MNTLLIGVIGLGRLGSFRATCIAEKIEGAKLIAVCDILPERVEEVGEKYNVPYRFTDYRELLNIEDLDGVIISNSSDKHFEVICEAAKKGRNIFCEKPIALTREELIGIEKVLTEGAIFQVGFTRRFDPDYRTVKDLVANGAIGTPISIKCLATESLDDIEFYKQFCPRSGGMIFDIGLHDIDMVRWFTGSEPTTVFSMGGAYGHEEVKAMGDIDNYLIVMKLENGIMAEMEAHKNPNSEFVRQVEISGTEGTITHRIDENSLITITNKHNENIVKGGLNTFSKYSELYLMELQEFVTCIRGEGNPSAVYYDGKVAVEIATDLERSLREECAVRR
ncbi:MAG: Gfo/Idh/MocA family oxidoreductase [Bacteroidetes bacterium]|nr:Gfo/Idh/MocA family oxidoreductase [Bacteroidota bacterium]